MTTNDDMREAVARAIGGREPNEDGHVFWTRLPSIVCYQLADAAIAAAEPGLRRKYRAEFLDELIAEAKIELRLTTSLNGGKNALLEDWLRARKEGV